jgi:hypothetical protein
MLKNRELEYRCLQLQHEIKVEPLRKLELIIQKVENDRKDLSVSVMKAHRDELPKFFEYVVLPYIHRYKIIDCLVPIHDGYEVDGILVSVPVHDENDYRKMPLR